MNFEDIRPYNDDEYQKIVKELFEVQPLMATIQRYLPELSFTEIKELLLSYNKIQDFQSKVVCRIITRILESSANNYLTPNNNNELNTKFGAACKISLIMYME
ncbi:MAG: hypothetical protein HRT73_13795 [Flavobacteriales bacterium]|nr:hypothetical protein [Flavobacteriales bacterium]